jgi:hypothetical protein
MNTLCLEKYGVSQMETQQMKDTNGGIAPWVVIAVIIFLASTEESY